ncbi:hypothetical protein [Helicobacter fennelliae]|nr:hypothetical protein [Helicobacter fennelliae]
MRRTKNPERIVIVRTIGRSNLEKMDCHSPKGLRNDDKIRF